jgi:TPR repeat protein
MLIEDLKDEESASEFYRFSAGMGHARSMHKLAVMMLFGRGVPYSPRHSKYFFVKLINAGSDHITTTYYNCMCALGVPSPGLQPAANITKEALFKMRSSVTKGLAYHLNHPWREVLAVEEKEIRTCMAQAQLVLGRHYLRASFVGQNVEEALKWLIESAKLGNADAMCTIGDAFTFQMAGTVQNVPLARKYYKLASSLGHKKAQRRIEALKDWS